MISYSDFWFLISKWKYKPYLSRIPLISHHFIADLDYLAKDSIKVCLFALNIYKYHLKLYTLFINFLVRDKGINHHSVASVFVFFIFLFLLLAFRFCCRISGWVSALVLFLFSIFDSRFPILLFTRSVGLPSFRSALLFPLPFGSYLEVWVRPTRLHFVFKIVSQILVFLNQLLLSWF